MSMQMTRRGMMKTAGLGALGLVVGLPRAILGGAKASGPRAYALPPLPYADDALAPTIDAAVVRIHHGKHHAGYVKGLNATLHALDQARAASDFSRVKALSRNLAFHGSGHVLHALYWHSMRPGGACEPTGALRQAIDRDFGSFAALKAQFVAATNQVEGSGWGLLGYEPVGRRLLVLQVEKHQNLTVWGIVPLMVCDVWEHAYYVQYQNRRAAYVDGFCKLIDWPGVAKRFTEATRGA